MVSATDVWSSQSSVADGTIIEDEEDTVNDASSKLMDSQLPLNNGLNLFSDKSPETTVTKSPFAHINSVFTNLTNDARPHAKVKIGDKELIGLLDSGVTCSFLGRGAMNLVEKLGLKMEPAQIKISTADGTSHSALHFVKVEMEYAGQKQSIPLLIVPSITKRLILGMDFWRLFNIVPQVMAMETEEEGYLSPVANSHNLSSMETETLQRAIDEFLFSATDRIGLTTLVEHSIDTGDAKPIRQRPHTTSPYMQKEIDEVVDRMLALKVIEPASGAWSNPMVAVRKSNGKLRYCLDARKLNSVTVPEAYPVQDLNRILGRLHSTKFLSSIDLSDAFWQVGLKKEDRPKTAFAVSGRGFFMFSRMPFGLINSAATLCRLVDLVIGCDLEPWVFKYLDDFIVATDTLERHLWVLTEIARRLRAAGLTISAEKSRFCMKELRYVGYLLTEDGIKPDPEKISAVMDFPAPTSVKETRRFLGMSGWYRRFIQDFSSISAPISELLKAKTKKDFCWSAEAQIAFDELKKRLTSAPVLANPDFSAPFFVQTDASDIGVGGILCQGEGNEERVITFFSKKLSRTQQKYSVTERECLAVILSLEKFRPYIEGTKFTVVTDHSSLCWLHNLKDPSGRLARWTLRLQPFNFKFIHRPGSKMVVPDALSRAIAMVDVAMHPITDPWYIDLRETVIQNPQYYANYRIENDILYKYCARGINEFDSRWKVVVPSDLRAEVLNECHDEPTAGHGGFFKTMGRVRQDYYWPRMAQDVRRYVGSCQICKMTKPSNELQRAPMGKQRDTDRPWRTISLDFMGPFPISNNDNRWLFVVVDSFSKFVVLTPMKNGTAASTIEVLKNFVFFRHSVPEIMLLDSGSQFRSNLFKKFADAFNVILWKNAFYHPQANPTEAANSTVVNAIRAYIKDELHHREWDVHLPQIECALNAAPHTSTSLSPHFVLYGEEMVLSGNTHRQKLDSEPTANKHDLFSRIRKRVREKLDEAYARRKTRYDLRTREICYQPGQKIYRRNFRLSKAGKFYMAKLAPKYIPAIVVEAAGTNCYRLADENGKELPGTYHTLDLRR